MEAMYNTYKWLEEARRGFGPVIVTAAVNGGIQGKEAHERLPETPQEIAQQAREAYDAGASVVHIHGRDPAIPFRATGDAEVYREINALVREACPDIVINNTTGGGPTITMEQRLACLSAAPELASLNLGPDMSRFKLAARPADLPGGGREETVYDRCVPYTYGILRQLAEAMRDHDVKPELETYQPGSFWVVRDLIEAGLIAQPYLHQFVMGYQTSSFATPEHLCALVRDLPAKSVFAVCGIGPYQLPMTTVSLVLGGHVRVGLEDNLYYSRGRKLRGNGEAVERAVRIATELNREVATPQHTREILGLASEPREFGASSASAAA
jgi:3-keto-5-aminohexanoate cleavage enzyme